MSVSSSNIGVTRTYDGGTNQYYMKTTDGTNYNEANFVGIAVGDEVAGLGQEPDEDANNDGNWVSNTTAPFPNQATTIASFAYTAGTKNCIQLNCNNANQIRVLAETIFPMFDNSAGLWDDLMAQAIVTGDKFITATDGQLKAGSGTPNVVHTCTAVSNATTSVNFYQPQLSTSDYYYVGIQTGTTDPKIAVAWNTGTSHF